MKYIIAIDQGTTGTTACLINSETFEFIGTSDRDHSQIFPNTGWVEHDLNEIWSSVKITITDLIKKYHVNTSSIIAIGITNQRETTCAFDKMGNPLTNAIVWQDRRTSDVCQKIGKDKSFIKKLKLITGLPLDPYFSATKMQWMLRNVDSVKKASVQNNCLFGNIDTFLTYKLTDGKSFSTDSSNASRTLLMDLKTGEWSEQLLKFFKIKKSMLPEIKDTFGIHGFTQSLGFLPDGIPISCLIGDQQSALFGQNGIRKGDLKCTYGTGAFLLLNTGTVPVFSKRGLLTTVAYKYNGKHVFALEGSCYIAGAAVQYLRDSFQFINHSSEIESLANTAHNLNEMKDIYFFPFFTGIGSPYWKSEAKATITGLSRGTHKGHVARACLEGICLSIQDLIKTMRLETKLGIKSLKVDGGAVVNNLLMNIQSTVSQTKIIRPKVIETTSYGAALGAAVGVGILKIEDINKLWQIDKSFEPISDWKKYYSIKEQKWSEFIEKIYL